MVSLRNLTPRQAEALSLLKRLTAAHPHGLTPTLTEMAAAAGVTPPCMSEHLRELEHKGHVRRERYKQRGIYLCGEATDARVRDAAPDLLAALVAAERWMTEYGCSHESHVLRNTRAAIARAKGPPA